MRLPLKSNAGDGSEWHRPNLVNRGVLLASELIARTSGCRGDDRRTTVHSSLHKGTGVGISRDIPRDSGRCPGNGCDRFHWAMRWRIVVLFGAWMTLGTNCA